MVKRRKLTFEDRRWFCQGSCDAHAHCPLHSIRSRGCERLWSAFIRPGHGSTSIDQTPTLTHTHTRTPIKPKHARTEHTHHTHTLFPGWEYINVANIKIPKVWLRACSTTAAPLPHIWELLYGKLTFGSNGKWFAVCLLLIISNIWERSECCGGQNASWGQIEDGWILLRMPL